MTILRNLFVIIILLLLPTLSFSANLKPRKAGAGDKCPVCGMFVAKYPDFAAQIHFKSGKVVHFDGTKDLFKYYLNEQKAKSGNVAAVYVTDYYSLTTIDGFNAFFVSGSNVYGPMGRELVAFATEKSAREFKKDHQGKRIVHFKAVTPAQIKELD